MSDPEAVQVRRRRALPEDRRPRCATCSASCPRRATTRCGSPSGPTSRSSSASRSCPTSRSPRASPTTPPTSSTSPSRAPRSGGATRCPTTVVERLAYELQVIADMGFARTSSSCGTSSSTPRTTASGSVRAGERGRLRGGLLPAHHRPRPDQYDLLFERFLNPTPHLDARHRHGLRLPLPRRDDPLRGRALRPRPRRADHHVLAPSRPGPRCATRPGCSATPTRSATRSPRRCRRWSWAATRRCTRCLERAREVRRRLQDGRRAAGDVRHRSRRQAGHRRRQGPRGPAPPGRHPRRRGGDHQGAAHRVPARSSASPRPGRTRRRPRSSRSTRCTASKTSAC